MKRALLLGLVACGAPARAPQQPPANKPPRTSVAWIDLRLGDPTWHVPGSVDAIAWSSDERRVVIGSEEGGVLVYDVATGAARTRVRVGGTVSRMSLVDDDHAFATAYVTDGDHDANVVVAIDLRARTVERTRLDASEAVALPGDAGAVLVETRDPGKLAIVDRATGDVKRTLDRSDGWVEPRIVGGRVLARHMDTVGIWDLATGARLARFGAPRVEALSPDGTLLAAGAFKDAGGWQVDLYSVADGKRLRSFAHGACDPDRGAFSPDGQLFATACDDGLRVFEVATGVPVAYVRAHLEYARALAFSPSGQRIAAGGMGDVVHVWNTDSYDELAIGDAHQGAISHIEVSADGKQLLTASLVDRSARLWDVATGRSLVMGDDAALTAAGLASGRVLTAFHRDTDAQLVEWSADEDYHRRTITLRGKGPAPIVRALEGWRDGGVVAVYDASAHVLDAGFGTVWSSTRSDPDDLGNGDAVFTEDGAKVAIVEQNGNLTIVDLAAQTQHDVSAHLCGYANAVAWTRDGTRLAVADGDGAVRLIDAATDRLTGGVVLPEAARELGTTRDRHVIALGDAHVYDIAPDGKVTGLPAPDTSALAVSPDGASIYLGRTDGTIARIARDRAAAVAEPVGAIPAEDPGECQPGGGGYGIGYGGGGTPRGKIDDSTPDTPGQTLP